MSLAFGLSGSALLPHSHGQASCAGNTLSGSKLSPIPCVEATSAYNNRLFLTLGISFNILTAEQ